MDINLYRQDIADLKAIAYKIIDEIEADFNQSEINFNNKKNQIIEERNNKIAEVTRDKNKEIDRIRESKDAEIEKIRKSKNLEIENMRNAVLEAIKVERY